MNYLKNKQNVANYSFVGFEFSLRTNYKSFKTDD